MRRRVGRQLVAQIEASLATVASLATLAILATQVAADDSGILKAQTNKATGRHTFISLQLTAMCPGVFQAVSCARVKASPTDCGQRYEQQLQQHSWHPAGRPSPR